MESKPVIILFSFLCLCHMQLASSQSQAQPAVSQFGQSGQAPQHHSNQPQPHAVTSEEGQSSGKSAGDVGYTHYTYRAPGASGAGSATYQNYPAANYARDVYGTSRDAAGNPIFGLSSNADFQLSAYFGQIFWGFVAVSVTLVVSIWIIKFFAGTDVVGGIVDKIKDSGATGKALDLDHLTNMVYQAVDTYGKWAIKEARQSVEVNQKGR